MNRADAIGEIYEAAFEADALSRLARILSATAKADSAVVSTIGPTGIDTRTDGLPEDVGRDYLAYYHAVNPWPRAALARGIGAALTRGDDLVPELEFRQTEFYTDFAGRTDTAEAIGCGFALGPETILQIGMHRRKHAKPFDARDCAAAAF